MTFFILALNLTNWYFLDNPKIVDVDKTVVGLPFEDSDNVVQAICGNFEVCEVARDG